jgi:hypothetical protein
VLGLQHCLAMLIGLITPAAIMVRGPRLQHARKRARTHARNHARNHACNMHCMK